MDEARQTALEDLKKHLGAIAAFDAVQLAEGSDLGAINFEAGRELFSNAIKLARETDALPLDLLPLPHLASLVQPAAQLSAALEDVSNFTLVGQAGPEQQRDTLLAKANKSNDAFFTTLFPCLSFLELRQTDIQHIVTRSAALLKTSGETLDSAETYATEKKEEIDSLVKSAKDAVAKVGVAQFATNFEEIADNHANSATRWLRATAGLAAATIAVAFLLVFVLPATAETATDASDTATTTGKIIALAVSDANALQRILTKLVVISLFYFAVVWSARNYRAHRHLYVVNNHRQNALMTFETFVKAADAGDIRNAVLLESTRCIFSPSVTGYLGKDEQQPSGRIIEILKTASAGS